MTTFWRVLCTSVKVTAVLTFIGLLLATVGITAEYVHRNHPTASVIFQGVWLLGIIVAVVGVTITECWKSCSK